MPNLYQDVPFSYATTNIDPNPYHPLTPVPYRRTTATSSSAITTAMLGQVFEDVDESHISSAHLFPESQRQERRPPTPDGVLSSPSSASGARGGHDSRLSLSPRDMSTITTVGSEKRRTVSFVRQERSLSISSDQTEVRCRLFWLIFGLFVYEEESSQPDKIHGLDRAAEHLHFLVICV